MLTNPQTKQVPYQPLTQMKPPPAPGSSPVGGTTHLPQYLNPQSPALGKPADMKEYISRAGAGTLGQYAPGSGGGAQGGMAAPKPATPMPVPASQQPGTVPPPPPSAPAIPPAPVRNTTNPNAPGFISPLSPAVDPDQDGKPGYRPGAGHNPNYRDLLPNAGGGQGGGQSGRNGQMGDELWKQLMGMLKDPSRYDEQANAMRQQGYGRLDDERRMAEDRATADAAKRGVYFGSPLTNSLGDINERYMRGVSDFETNLNVDMARNFQNDRLRAIEAIFGYGDRQRDDRRLGLEDERTGYEGERIDLERERMERDLWLRMLEAGMVGGPQLPTVSF